MKAPSNRLRVVLRDPPTAWGGMADVEPMLETKDGPRPGARTEDGDVSFETSFAYDPDVRGPALKREKDGRRFVYVGWYGTLGGERTRFRRLKVHLEGVPTLVWDAEVTVAGRGGDGGPACATARVLSARNVEPA